MATSGSVDYALTGRDIVDQALILLSVVPSGNSATGADASDATTALNLMLKTWGASGRLWLKAEGSVTLLASTASYSLGTGVRRVLSVRRRTSSLDTPLSELSREEYFDLPTKSATGMPVNWYYDPQRSTRTLYVWPTATAAVAANTTLPYTYARIIEDVDALSNDPDVPQEWLEPLIYGLAKRLGPRFGGIGSPEYAAIVAMADQLYAGMSSLDQESASLYFQPG